MRTIISLLLLLLALTASSLLVNIQVIPDTVGQDAVMTLLIIPGVSVPKYGGFTISVPSKFKSVADGQIQCTVDDQVGIQLQGCDTLSEKEVQVTLASSIHANTEVLLDISIFQNPASTASNKDFAVSTFGSNGVVLEMITSASSNFDLKVRQLSPGVLTAFEVNTDSDRIGATDTSLSISLTPSSDLPCSDEHGGCLVTLNVPALGDRAHPEKLTIDEDELKCEIIKVSFFFSSNFSGLF